MHDMTTGPIRGHVLRMMSFMLVGMMVQTAYSLVDIYWVSHLGKQAIAAVAVASNLMFVVIAISQILGVGTVALVSQAAGRKDHADIQRLFTQSNGLSIAAGLLFLLLALALQGPYARALGSDAETTALIEQFLAWFIPAMALQFTMVGLASSLRGVGHMRPGMIAQVGSVLLNMLLAPVFIFGWLGMPAMGVAGASAATFIATAAAVIGLLLYLRRGDTYLRVQKSQLAPDFALWRRLLAIGLPAGGEFFLMALILGVIYALLRPFGPEAQAGFGIGMRIMQAGFMPAVALSFGAAAVAGQNFGARQIDRVRRTFAESAKIAIAFMLAFTLICHLLPETLMRMFSSDPTVISIGADYLQIVSYSYIGSALVIVSGGMFQGLGNAWPSLLASGSRLLTYILPAIWLSRQSGFHLTQIWAASVISIVLQTLLSLSLLRREFNRKLGPRGGAVQPTQAAV